MKPTEQPFETKGHDLSGSASLEFHDSETINSFTSLIPGMDASRFDPVALKIFLSGETPLITLYAIDKLKMDTNKMMADEMPVRKFKSPISWPELFRFVKSFDLVVNDGRYNLENMRVENR